MHPALLFFQSPLGKHLLIAAGITVTASLLYHVVWTRGYDAAVRNQQTTLAQSLERGLEQARDIARQDAEITEYYENWRVRYVTQLQTQVAEVEQSVQDDCTKCGIRPDGLRALNNFRVPGGPYSAHPGQPYGGVFATPPTYDGIMPRDNRRISPRQPPVQRLRDETQGVDRSST